MKDERKLVLVVGNNYKGEAVTIQLGKVQIFPKGKRLVNKFITERRISVEKYPQLERYLKYGTKPYNETIFNKPVGMSKVRAFDLPSDIENYWDNKEYLTTSELAAQKQQLNEDLPFLTALSKAETQVLKNCPRILHIVANSAYNDIVKIIKDALTHGTFVVFTNLGNDTTYRIASVGNLDLDPYNQTFLCSPKAAEYILHNRNNRRNAMYRAAQLAIIDISRDKKRERLENSGVYQAEQELSLDIDNFIQFAPETLDSKNPEAGRLKLEAKWLTVTERELERKAYIIDTYGPCLGVTAITNPTDSNIGTFTPLSWMTDYKPATGGEYNEYLVSSNIIELDVPAQEYMLKKIRARMEKLKVRKAEIIEKYEYINYFIQNNLLAEFMNDNFTFCPVCNMPRPRNSNPWSTEELAICPHCGDGRDVPDPVNPTFLAGGNYDEYEVTASRAIK